MYWCDQNRLNTRCINQKRKIDIIDITRVFSLLKINLLSRKQFSHLPNLSCIVVHERNWEYAGFYFFDICDSALAIDIK